MKLIVSPERLDVPPAAFVALFGMFAIAAINITRVLRAALALDGEYQVGVVIGVTVATASVLSFLPLLAAWGLRSAWKSAPIISTIVGIWAAPQILGYADLLNVVCGVVGITAVVAVWLPSARRYGRDLRALRAV